MVIVRMIIFLVIACTLITTASAVPGIATYYDKYLPSACFGYQDHGTFLASVNRRLYSNRAACGRRYRVRCTGGANLTPNPCRNGEVTVTVVDLCPGCADDQIGLSQPAFSRIGNLVAGKIRIDYVMV